MRILLILIGVIYSVWKISARSVVTSFFIWNYMSECLIVIPFILLRFFFQLNIIQRVCMIIESIN